MQPHFPIRAAFYYPWFPEAWTQKGIYPFTNYTPSLGYYNSGDEATIKKHIAAMQYGRIQAGISSWWGPGHYTDNRVTALLAAAAGSSFRWALYYENESQGDPSVSQIQNDLIYIRDRYGSDRSYLRINGKFVVFVYADANDGCLMADRWKQANTVGAYIILKVFGGYESCTSQPDSWHQYSPAVPVDQQGTLSYAISPGFWLKGDPERLNRDLNRWAGNIRDMVASQANWQLITTFNEWGEGTSVEQAQEWTTPSTYGSYLDALHVDGQVPSATSTPADTPTTAPSATLPVPTETPVPPGSGSNTFTPLADAYVDSSLPNNNYGTAATLRIDGSPVVRSYMRFDLNGLAGSVTDAKLRVFANSASSAGISVSGVASSDWTETGITYSNAPALGSVAATTGAVAAGTWKELDVTRLITGDSISLGLSTSGGTAISLASRESGANAPQLVVTAGESSAVLYAAGDIAKCGGVAPGPGNGAVITSDMLLSISGPIFTLGDNSNDSGSLSDYNTCYQPTWGRLKDRTYPAMGNHDISTDGQGYFAYFSGMTGASGHYSLNLGAWHIVVLNAECSIGGQGCGAGSTQETWLRQDLAANLQRCTLAIWHQPLFTTGTQSTTPSMAAFWQALYDYGAEVILNGHNHNYERFAPQDPNGQAAANGIREFVVGTGGASLDSSSLPLAANQEVRSATAYGVLKLTLKPDRYEWQFVPQPGKSFTDSGSGDCH